jgi:hypothetical protein
MTYRPTGSVSFGPPLNERFLSLGYLLFAVVVTGVILYGHAAPSNSRIFRYVVEGDRDRMISSTVCAIVLCLSALAAVLREQMRGVIVHPDGIELRELLAFGIPRVRRLHWSQIDRLFVPKAKSHEISHGESKGRAEDSGQAKSGKSIGLDLWDGSRTWLPDVANLMGLAVLLERVALARAIPIVGGTGLIDDLGNPL